MLTRVSILLGCVHVDVCLSGRSIRVDPAGIGSVKKIVSVRHRFMGVGPYGQGMNRNR